ncbi:MAG: hypothetical protein JKY55_20445 [Aliivibrio sp.]|uniref:hypothetical protein n=1 Tax=Aliivibrio sp. TaxID=1872443 RepID=UPI001A45CC46|nr:hypothetical protein [Aliivibrio sp.]
MALTNDRPTPRRANIDNNDPVAAAKKIFAGAIVMLDVLGNATPGVTATGLIARGVAQENVNNATGAAGAVTVKSMKGCFRFKNDGSVTRTDISKTAFVVDDETVANTNGTNTRSALGIITDVDAIGVWVAL